jgi:hypothetical protein
MGMRKQVIQLTIARPETSSLSAESESGFRNRQTRTGATPNMGRNLGL